MTENILKENKKLEVLVNETVFPDKNFHYISIAPESGAEHFYAEVFIDNKCKEHFFERSMSGRYVLYLDDYFVEENNLDIKYFKINILE
jgi:hypothetical protein